MISKQDRELNYRISFWAVAIFMLFILFAITGCSTIDGAIDKVKNLSSVEEEPELVCPVCPEVICGDLELAGYYSVTSDIRAQTNRFILNANEYLYCSFRAIEDEDVAKNIIFANRNMPVQIILDTISTMDYCDVSCVPKLTSQYNKLLSNNVEIKTVSDIYSNYCVSEDGVLYMSYIPGSEGKHTAIYLYGETAIVEFTNIFERQYG